VFVRAVAGTPL